MKAFYTGSIVPLVTPFHKNGEVDSKALEELIEWHIAEGTDGIVCLGTTGEAPTLSHEEKLHVVKTCKKVIRKRISLIVGTGTYSTKETVAFTNEVKGIGVDGCLVVVPYYNKPTPRGCLEHFRAVFQVGLPVILYHHPGRTGIRLSPSLLAQMYEEKLFVAIKECTSDPLFIKELASLCNAPLLSGDEMFTFTIMRYNRTGAVSVIANVFPREWKKVIDLCMQNKLEEGERLAKRYTQLIEALFIETNPIPVKYAVSLLGKCEASLRLPLVEPEESTKECIRKGLDINGREVGLEALELS